MNCPSYNWFFESIAPEMRMKILFALKDRAMSVNELADSLSEEQSKISHNLKKLTECSFLDVKRKGKKRVYSLRKETVLPLLKVVERHAQRFCSRGCGRLCY